MLGLICVTAVMSLLAVVIELPAIKQLPSDLRQVHIALTALVLVGTWLLIPTAFTMHYAHNYYVNMRQQRVLQFPDRPDEPLCSDFLYFSFTIAVASQTADIAVASYQIRQVVLIQSILKEFCGSATESHCWDLAMIVFKMSIFVSFIVFVELGAYWT